MTTAADLKAKSEAKLAVDMDRMAREQAIHMSLVEHVPSLPTISNIPAPGKTSYKGHAAVLTFRKPSYDPDKTYEPTAYMWGLERAGYELLPACLPSWGMYRAAFEAADDQGQPLVPSTKDKLRTLVDVAPFAIRASSFTGAELQYFVRSTSTGETFAVHIDVPGCGFSVSGSRNNWAGDWNYRSVSLRSPRVHPEFAEGTKAFGQGTKGIDGRFYFVPLTFEDCTAEEFYEALVSGCE